MVWSEPKVAQAIHLCFAPKMSVMRGDTPPAYFATQGTITTVFPSYWNTMGPNLLKRVFNNRFLRERGMAFNPKNGIPGFSLYFPKELSLAKLNWDSQLGRTFFLSSQRNFPISFKPKVSITEFLWKMQRKTWYSILGLDAMPLSLKNLSLSKYKFICYIWIYWTIYSATTFLESCRKVVREKWFEKSGSRNLVREKWLTRKKGGFIL